MFLIRSNAQLPIVSAERVRGRGKRGRFTSARPACRHSVRVARHGLFYILIFLVFRNRADHCRQVATLVMVPGRRTVCRPRFLSITVRPVGVAGRLQTCEDNRMARANHRRFCDSCVPTFFSIRVKFPLFIVFVVALFAVRITTLSAATDVFILISRFI